MHYTFIQFFYKGQLEDSGLCSKNKIMSKRDIFHLLAFKLLISSINVIVPMASHRSSVGMISNPSTEIIMESCA